MQNSYIQINIRTSLQNEMWFGKRIVIPSSFTGGAWYMLQNYFDNQQPKCVTQNFTLKQNWQKFGYKNKMERTNMFLVPCPNQISLNLVQKFHVNLMLLKVVVQWCFKSI